MEEILINFRNTVIFLWKQTKLTGKKVTIKISWIMMLLSSVKLFLTSEIKVLVILYTLTSFSCWNGVTVNANVKAIQKGLVCYGKCFPWTVTMLFRLYKLRNNWVLCILNVTLCKNAEFEVPWLLPLACFS